MALETGFCFERIRAGIDSHYFTKFFGLDVMEEWNVLCAPCYVPRGFEGGVTALDVF